MPIPGTIENLPDGIRQRNFRQDAVESRNQTSTNDEDSELSECECQTREYPPWTGEIHGMSQVNLFFFTMVTQRHYI